MATIEYDLDTSGGLMPQIQALIAPPISEEAAKAKKKEGKDLHPYYKRPGKGHNHDCCDACSEGGDLLCCDKCPASFHLQCHDPPLDEGDIPIGEWLCHCCRLAAMKGESENSSIISAKSDSRTTKDGKGPVRTRLRGRRDPAELPTNERRSRHTDGAASSLEMLVKAASAMNPKQFELPREMSMSLPFPGTDKIPGPSKVTSRRNSVAKKKPYELDNGMVPLPVKVCFECRRSCRKAPLIACDYCPLLFHQDCLDPPLTSLPTGHWMCPNHPEQFLDKALLTSCSATERVKLWDRYSGPIDQDAIKCEFIRKAHRQFPLFRYKVKLAPRNTVRVPDSVKAHYRSPPPLVPSLREVLREEEAMLAMERREREAAITPCEVMAPTPEEQEQWLSSIISLQTSIACHMALQKQQEESKSTVVSESESHSAIKTTCLPLDSVSGNSVKCGEMSNSLVQSALTRTMVMNGDTLVHTMTTATVAAPSAGSAMATKVVMNGPVSVLKDKQTGLIVTGVQQQQQNGEMKCNVSCKEEQNEQECSKQTVPAAMSPVPSTNHTNGTASNMLTPCQLAKLKPGTTSILQPRQGCPRTSVVRPTMGKVAMVTAAPTPGAPGGTKLVTLRAASKGAVTTLVGSPALGHLSMQLQAALSGASMSGSQELSKLDERLVQLLAYQRLQQLLPSGAVSPNPESPPSPAVQLTTPTSPVPSLSQPQRSCSSPTSLLPLLKEEQVQARAILCPLTGRGSPCSMPYRTLTVGTGADNDLVLVNYGHCNFISPKHASIFFDETTKHYELLNYSEHGTTVDNVLYSCDFSEKLSSDKSNVQPLVKAIRSIIDKRRGTCRLQEEDVDAPVHKMAARSGKEDRKCSCRTSSSSLIGGSGAGWEGTALVNHGSYIKFGCLQFVFSITDYAPSKSQVDFNCRTVMKQETASPS